MEVVIRPIDIEDASDLNKIRIMEGVRENTLAISSERVTSTEDYLANLTPNNHLFVAEVEENGTKKIVGVVGLNIYSLPRLRHSASIGIMVHRDYQNMGIETKLLKKVIDLADKELMLVRVELNVYVDNERAIKLYESFGFKIEGRKKYASIRNGEYVDEYLMARYNLK
jgi:putative acetyltransferase